MNIPTQYNEFFKLDNSVVKISPGDGDTESYPQTFNFINFTNFQTQKPVIKSPGQL